MKKNHRILAAALALLLCLSVALAAFAEGGSVSRMYSAAADLLFATDNVSLTANVSFSYDGVPFKTMTADYAQDGVNSKMTVHMDSRTTTGRGYEGGYTVIANDGVAYSIEEDTPYIYNTSYCAQTASILSTTALRRAVLSLGSAIAGATENAFADKIFAEDVQGVTRYHVALAEGDAPQLVNAAGTLLFQVAAQRFFYMDYDQVTDEPSMDVEPMEEEHYGEYCDVVYDDYDASFATVYKKLYGEDMPEDFYDQLWGLDGEMNQELYARYSKVVDELYETYYEPASGQYATGVVLVYADGTTTYYATQDEYMVANDLQYPYFDDYDETFLHYYAEKTGETLTALELSAIYYSGNEDLLNVFYALSDEMYDYYDGLVMADGKASVIHVFTDGSYELVYDVRAFWNENTYGETYVYKVLSSVRALELGASDFTVTLDAEGRFASAKGSMTILVVDAAGEKHPLAVDFDLTAGAYGETKVDAFDPAAYGVCTWEDFFTSDNDFDYEAYYEATYESFLKSLPETVTFQGVTYTTDIDFDLYL